MLVGNLVYKYKDKSFKYQLKGIDCSSALSLKITSMNYDAICFLANENYEGVDDTIWDRRFDVELSSVKVETPNHTVNGKTVKEDVNSTFFCRLGALIRYAKMNCILNNQEGFSGLQLASGEFEVSAVSKYHINLPDSNVHFADVTLDYGDIIELHIITDTVELNLVDDKGAELELFPAIKNGQKLGVKFNSDYLGFEVPVQKIDLATVNGMYTCIEDIVKAHPDKEFSWLLEKDYKIVSDDNLEEICEYIRNWDGYVFYDTETTGLNITFKSRIGQADQLVGVVLSVKYGESFFFPTQMKSIPNLCGGDHWYFMEHYMRPILEGKELVAHNMSFDWKVAYIYDINCNIVHDTMALIKLTIGAEKKNYPMGLKENTKLLLNRDSLELSDLVVDDSWGESNIKFWDLPYELVRLYACADTDNTNGLLGYAIQNDLLAKYSAKKVYEIEIAFSYAVAYQEFYGHRIDIQNLNKMREEIGQEQTKYMNEMVKMIGHEFNPNSPKQLQQVMYVELGIPEQISRKTGRVTTDKETLNKLAEITDAEDNIKYPFCVLLQKYRQAEGVRKIVDKFPEHMTEDGYIFSSVMQYGTTTGRVSINNPNYQSYNDPVKKNVVPRPGFWMFDTDYSSVEYRVLGNMVGNKRIMESFEDPDFDYHAYQAAHMYGVPYSAVTKKLRKAAKGINFGLPYGMGDESLGVRVFGEASPENTRKAAALRAAYFKGQEDIRDWFEYHRNRGVNEGFTETYFGRRRYYHRQDFSANAIRRQAGNQVIQGTAADIYKTAVGRVFKRICREGWLGKVMFTGFIHDELLGEVSNSINPGEFLKVLREEFEVKITNPDGSPWCPLYMGFGYGMSWYEAKSVELPIKLQWEFVEKYGETGFPEWDGDGRKFCDTIPDKLRDFEVRDIRNQILDADSQGKEIKPTLNNQVLDCVKADAKLYTKGIEEYADDMGWRLDTMEEVDSWLYNNREEIIKDLDKKYHIQDLYYSEKDNNGYPIYELSFEPSKSTQEALTQFCKLHGVDREKVNLLDIEEYNGSGAVDADYSIEYDEDSSSEERLEHIKNVKIDTLGMYVDIDNKQVTLLMVPKNYMDFIQAHVNRDKEGYQVFFKDGSTGQLYECQAWLTSQEITVIQDMYITYFKTVR